MHGNFILCIKVQNPVWNLKFLQRLRWRLMSYDGMCDFYTYIKRFEGIPASIISVAKCELNFIFDLE
jgi:hypothetical protein